MINLIPATAKKRVIFEYWLRVGSIWVILASLIIIMLMILLIPVYVLIFSQTKEFTLEAEKATIEVERYAVSSAVLIQTSQRARLLLATTEQPNFSSIIKTIEAVPRTGITLTGYELSRSREKVGPIQIAGRAETRQGLSMFREGLLKNPDIKTVFLPISNLTRDRDILFSVTITLAETKAN